MRVSPKGETSFLTRERVAVMAKPAASQVKVACSARAVGLSACRRICVVTSNCMRHTHVGWLVPFGGCVDVATCAAMAATCTTSVGGIPT